MMNQDFSLFEQRLIEAGYDSEVIEQILEVAQNSIYPKKYGLVWEEKEEKIKEELKLKIPYLEESKEREINLSEPNSPQHLLIEGDNYEALKLLQTTHRGKVDIIYIDPPYNTGNEFVYNDKLVDKEDGYRHSKWLSFMHKRLTLAKELMKDVGTMFISIDDNEMAPLKLLCDDIFGENNVEIMIWKKTQANEGVMKISHRFRCEHEYIFVVYKNKKNVKFNRILDFSELKNSYGNIDNDYRGNWISAEICKSESKSNKNGKNYYTLTTPSGKEYTRQWHFSEEEIKTLIADNRVYFGKDGTAVPRLKKFTNEKREKVPTSIIQNKGTAKGSNKELTEIFGKKVFDYPKPLELIKYLHTISEKKSETVILDFFAGSGTTGHAVLELNQEDGGNRQFILCTNNENNICEEVTYERLKRVMEGYTTPKGKEVEGLPANLKYLKVGMVEKETYTDEDLSRLYMPHVLPLLQLKHNAFTLVSETKHGWVFEGDGFRFGLADPLATKRDFDRLKEQLETYEGEKILYLFSTDTKSYPKYKQLASLDEIIRPIPREMLELLKGE